MVRWFRGGNSSSQWTEAGRGVKPSRAGGNAIRLNFSIAAAGGGVTDIEVLIEPDDFEALHKLMGPSHETAGLMAHWAIREATLQQKINELETTIRTAAVRPDARVALITKLQQQIDGLETRILNESVVPDRVAAFRKTVLAAVIKAVLES